MNLALVRCMSTQHIFNSSVVSSICALMYADAGGNSLLIPDSCVAFQDLPFPLITPFRCDALKNQDLRMTWEWLENETLSDLNTWDIIRPSRFTSHPDSPHLQIVALPRLTPPPDLSGLQECRPPSNCWQPGIRGRYHSMQVAQILRHIRSHLTPGFEPGQIQHHTSFEVPPELHTVEIQRPTSFRATQGLEGAQARGARRKSEQFFWVTYFLGGEGIWGGVKKDLYGALDFEFQGYLFRASKHKLWRSV